MPWRSSPRWRWRVRGARVVEPVSRVVALDLALWRSRSPKIASRPEAVFLVSASKGVVISFATRRAVLAVGTRRFAGTAIWFRLAIAAAAASQAGSCSVLPSCSGVRLSVRRRSRCSAGAEGSAQLFDVGLGAHQRFNRRRVAVSVAVALATDRAAVGGRTQFEHVREVLAGVAGDEPVHRIRDRRASCSRQVEFCSDQATGPFRSLSSSPTGDLFTRVRAEFGVVRVRRPASSLRECAPISRLFCSPTGEFFARVAADFGVVRVRRPTAFGRVSSAAR